MSQWLETNSESLSEYKRGQQQDRGYLGDVVSVTTDDAKSDTRTETPGTQTTTKLTPPQSSKSIQTTIPGNETRTETTPEHTVTTTRSIHIGVAFEFTIQVTSISPVDPAGGNGLSC